MTMMTTTTTAVESAGVENEICIENDLGLGLHHGLRRFGEVSTTAIAGKRWSEKQTGIFDWQVKTIAGALDKADCQGESRHPDTCKMVGCKVTQ